MMTSAGTTPAWMHRWADPGPLGRVHDAGNDVKLPSGLYLSINASPATIVSAEFRAAMATIPAERVVLKLTAHTGIDNHHLFGEAIAELRSNGLRLAVDDAGAGFSSFRHILNLRPDIIKLDIALTRGIDTDPARRALESAMLAFGLDAYNASMVAEGVETQSELATLQGLGCHYGQGYYLGRRPKCRCCHDRCRRPEPARLRSCANRR